MAFIRRVRTGSGATAVQIAEYANGRQRIVEHVGSAHTEAELGVLLGEVIDRDVPFLGLCYGIGTLGTRLGGVVDRTYGEPVGRIDDHHWNEHGHERAAEYLRDQLKGSLEESKPPN